MGCVRGSQTRDTFRFSVILHMYSCVSVTTPCQIPEYRQTGRSSTKACSADTSERCLQIKPSIRSQARNSRENPDDIRSAQVRVAGFSEDSVSSSTVPYGAKFLQSIVSSLMSSTPFHRLFYDSSVRIVSMQGTAKS